MKTISGSKFLIKKLVFIVVFLSITGIGNGIQLGGACGRLPFDIKRYMLKNGKIGCFKCNVNEYWHRRNKECIRCTGFLTNLIPNVRTSCGDKREIEKTLVVDVDVTSIFNSSPTTVPDNQYNITETFTAPTIYNTTVDKLVTTTDLTKNINKKRTRGPKAERRLRKKPRQGRRNQKMKRRKRPKKKRANKKLKMRKRKNTKKLANI